MRVRVERKPESGPKSVALKDVPAGRRVVMGPVSPCSSEWLVTDWSHPDLNSRLLVNPKTGTATFYDGVVPLTLLPEDKPQPSAWVKAGTVKPGEEFWFGNELWLMTRLNCALTEMKDGVRTVNHAVSVVDGRYHQFGGDVLVSPAKGKWVEA